MSVQSIRIRSETRNSGEWRLTFIVSIVGEISVLNIRLPLPPRCSVKL